MPFEKLVELLQPERNLSHNPLVQVMFALQNVPTMGTVAQARPEEAEAATVSENIPPIFLGTAKFDLTLSLTETDNGLAGVFEYNTDLFDRGRSGG